THLILVYVGWQLALATARILQQLTGQKVTTLLIHPWVPLVSALGVCVTFAILKPGSSRGLDAYDQEMACFLYWVATVAPFVLASLHIVPRLTRGPSVIRRADWLSRAPLAWLWLSCVGVPLRVVGWTVTAFAPAFYTIREIVVNGTLLLFCP